MSMQADVDDVVPAKIAIIGMACRFPGANSLDQYWRNLREGVESIRTFSGAELLAAGVPRRLIDDVHYVRASAPACLQSPGDSVLSRRRVRDRHRPVEPAVLAASRRADR